MDTLSDLVPSLDSIVDMDNLFANKLFFLIYIVVKDDVMELSLVKPFGNEEMQKDVQRNGYRCISHVWGITDPKKDYVWKDHGIVGITWNVETRIEKRERLLQIFKYHRGYFWMDNLCIDQSKGPEDKPLEIMGHIYRKCKECVCMLDYKPINNERERIEELLENLTEERIVNFHEKYEDSNIFDHISGMANCQWLTRMWTVQEVVLSPTAVFCSEMSNGCEYIPIDRSLLEFSYEKTRWMIGKLLKYPDVLNELEPIFYRIWYLSGSMDTLMSTMGNADRKCTNPLDYIHSVSGMFQLDIPKNSTIKNIRSHMIFQLWKRGVHMMDKSGIEKWGNSTEVYKMWSICEYGSVIGSADCLDMDQVNYGKILSKKVLVRTGKKLVKKIGDADIDNRLIHPRGSKNFMSVHDFIKGQISIIRGIFGVIPEDVDISSITTSIMSRFRQGNYTNHEMEYSVDGSIIGLKTFISAFFYVWKTGNADSGEESEMFHNPGKIYVYKTDKVDMISKREINLDVGDELVMGEFGNPSYQGLSYREGRDSTVFYVADDRVLSIGRVNRRDDGITQHEGKYQRSTWSDKIYPNKGIAERHNRNDWKKTISSVDDSSENEYDDSLTKAAMMKAIMASRMINHKTSFHNVC
jgi:hypothetical protein